MRPGTPKAPQAAVSFSCRAVDDMTKTEERKLKTALRRLEKCGGDCHHCEKCRVYTRSTERALFMAVGCDLLPVEMFSYIADTSKGLHAAALEIARFELEAVQL